MIKDSGGGQNQVKSVFTNVAFDVTKEFQSTGLVCDTDMSSASFLWNTKMAAMTQSENTTLKRGSGGRGSVSKCRGGPIKSSSINLPIIGGALNGTGLP